MGAAVGEGKPRAFCKALEFLLDRVNAMRIDAANCRLCLVAPVIKDHGVDYERGKFQDKLNDGTLTLERTQAWIRGALRWAVEDGCVLLEAAIEGNAGAFNRVHFTAVMALVADPTPMKADACPETLLLDVNRIVNLQREFSYQVSAITVLVTAAHSAGPDDKLLAGVAAGLADVGSVYLDIEQVFVECFALVLVLDLNLPGPGGCRHRRGAGVEAL